MDYIIFGMGTGASLVLVGWLLRELGPRIRDRAPAKGTVLSGGELVMRMAWARFCGTCGMALLLCGLLILLVAGILTLLAPSDDLGTAVILAVFGLVGVLMLIWTALYLRQFGTMGIVRRKVRKETVAVPAVEEATPETGKEPAASDPGEPVAGVPFDQAATSRGGFGRFGGLIRRQPEQDMAAVAAEDSQPDDTSASMDEDTGDEKVLDPDDLLVTEPQEEAGASDAVEPGDDDPSGVEPADEAIATLRQRRLARLAQDPDDTPED